MSFPMNPVSAIYVITPVVEFIEDSVPFEGFPTIENKSTLLSWFSFILLECLRTFLQPDLKPQGLRHEQKGGTQHEKSH